MGSKLNYKDILNNIARKNGTSREMTSEESNLLKKCLFSTAVDLDDRCRKNGIRLFLVGGSLLGAVRYKNFIPWDDDMDFGLLREDYEKLKNIFDEVFADTYELRCPNSPYPNGNRFMQIYVKGTVLKTVGEENPLQPQSVSIDIFPYDFVPEKCIVRKLKGIISNILMFIASCVMDEVYMSKEYKDFLKKSKDGGIYIKIRSIVGKLFSWKKPEKWFDIVDNKMQYKQTPILTSATGRNHYFGEMFSMDVFFPLKEMIFNNHLFYAPRSWDIYLEGIYGKDYMVPPSIDQRESHFIKEFSISKE